MAHKCTSRGCEFSLPDTYPLPKCPWHMVPGRGPVKIAAALAVAAAGLGGGLAYKKFKTYLHEKQLRKERKERRQRDALLHFHEEILPRITRIKTERRETDFEKKDGV